MRPVLLTILLCFAGVTPGRCVAGQVAEAFVIITDNAFKSAGGKSPQVAKGETVLSLEKREGDVLHVLYLGPRGMAYGSVARSDVIPLAESLDFLTKEVLRTPTAAAYLHRATAWSAQGDIENALADCNQAIRLEPKNATAYEIRGTIWQQWDNEEKALTDWTTAIRLDPKQLMAHFYLARHWNSGRQLEKAISEYGKVLQIDPKFLDAESRRGDLVELKAANDKTITECDQAIAADPTDANAYRRRGSAWIVRGERDKAIADWTAAIRLSPQDASAYKTRGSRDSPRVNTTVRSMTGARSSSFNRINRWRTRTEPTHGQKRVRSTRRSPI